MLKKSQAQQKDRIACPSSETVIKLVEMLQQEIKHSIRQIELLTGQPVSIGSQRWSVKRICSAKLADIRKQNDLWAAYVRGFTEGYKLAQKKSHSNSCQLLPTKSEQQLEVEPNSTLTPNSKTQRYRLRPRSLKEVPVPSIERPEVCEEVATNSCSVPTVTMDPSEELMVLEPDMKAYFAQKTQDSSPKLNKNVI